MATLHAIGKTKECAEAFERLRGMSGHIDSLDTPRFQRLAPIARDLKLPADWRLKKPFPPDYGKRPPMESIGPLVWQPTAAPSWELPDARGKPISLKDYAGKPTLVVFYLGYGCTHCMEQLGKFSGSAKSFADAGISVVAVSTDSQEALAAALAAPDARRFAFPIASDAKCDVFKQYRAYDDFERQPLHGTFLIDRDGLFRWHDIGHEPFMDAGFVLTEARRLLSLPVR